MVQENNPILRAKICGTDLHNHSCHACRGLDQQITDLPKRVTVAMICAFAISDKYLPASPSICFHEEPHDWIGFNLQKHTNSGHSPLPENEESREGLKRYTHVKWLAHTMCMVENLEPLDVCKAEAYLIFVENKVGRYMRIRIDWLVRNHRMRFSGGDTLMRRIWPVGFRNRPVPLPLCLTASDKQHLPVASLLYLSQRGSM